MKGVLAGALALVALHTLVAYRGPSRRFSDLAGGNGILVTAVRRFLDPTEPALGSRGGSATASSSSSGPPALTTLERRNYPAPTAR